MAPHHRAGWRFAAVGVSLLTVLSFGTQPVQARSIPTAANLVRAHRDDALFRVKARYYDARAQQRQVRQAIREATLAKGAPPALRALHADLGVQGVVQLDPVTGTPRVVAKLNGFLSGPRSGSARAIALEYLRRHEAAFGITDATLATLSFRGDYVSIDGTHHLSWTQSHAGIPVFGAGVKINVTKDGRVINVLGSPVARVEAASTAPTVSPATAIATAVRDARLTHVRGLPSISASGTVRQTGPTATRVYFPMANGAHLAWQTFLTGKQGMYLTVVDATSGKTLYRHSLTDQASASVFENYPGASVGGTQHTVNLTPLLAATKRLFGTNAWVYSDTNDDNKAQASEEIRPNAKGNWTFPFVAFHDTKNSPCRAAHPCAWNSRLDPLKNPTGAFSWRTNRRQSGAQLFWFLNRYHNHLQAKPIGFTQAAGNFQLFNPSGNGYGGDPVLGQAMDGANTLDIGGGPMGLPDPNHTDNANMSTPPDGFAPTMQMYLWNDPVTSFLGGAGADPFFQVDGADSSDIVFHEYTHGLSNRLVVDASGFSTLGNTQAGAMGEAWSDWYALDFLVNRHLWTDTGAPGELREGRSVEGTRDLIRTEPIDCPVGSTSPRCPGTPTVGHAGGYTYGDYGAIIGQPEVHADGEIWGQTLWDLRTALGPATSEGLITRAMELSPANPSFLDERNAILQADEVLNAGANQDTIWTVFAHRGMGYFAGTLNGDDSKPIEDFSMPPSPGDPKGTVSGTVTDAGTTDPIQGAVVSFGGHDSGFAGDYLAVTDAGGSYSIPNVFTGSYPDVNAVADGYDIGVKTVDVATGTNTVDWALARDWASASGGGLVAAFDGPDYSPFGCGPDGAIDGSLGTGWGSSTDTNDGAETGNVTPKHIEIQLPVAVDVSSIAVDPSHTCGDPLSSSTHDYRVETSADGTSWTLWHTGTFYAGNTGQLNDVPADGGALTASVQFVRFTMLNPMVPTTGDTCTNATDCPPDPTGPGGVSQRCGPAAPDPGAFGGCAFMDMSELEVYGSQAP